MEPVRISEIMEWTDGRLMSGDPESVVTGVSTDSRSAGESDLFIPLIGENHDAHEYVRDVYENGGRAFLVSEMKAVEMLPDASVVLVDDTLDAMQRFAAKYLESLDLIKIAVTGSVGKTSTRDMIYYIMSTAYKTARPEKNYNNEVGVPLTIFGLDSSYGAVVFEEGLEYPGDIHKLSEITKPDIAVVTNVGISHLENFRDRDALHDAKMEVADFMGPEGTLVLNTSCDIITRESSKGVNKVVTCGESVDDDYMISDVDDEGILGVSFTIYSRYEGERKVKLMVPGAHNAMNACLSIAAAKAAGIKMDDAVKGLKDLELTGKRLFVKEARGMIVIDDSYNAAPQSMRSAIDTLMNTKAKRHVAVLAGMNELGDDWVKHHVDIGKYLAEKGVDEIIGVGDKARHIVEGAMEANCKYAAWFDEKSDLISDKDIYFKSGDAVLVKGSNAYGMSEIADGITEKEK